MKAIIIAALAALHISVYPTTAKIVSLDYTSDVVTVETSTGFLYQYYGCEDYLVGNLVSMIMYDNGTANITDDKILNVKYSGYDAR